MSEQKQIRFRFNQQRPGAIEVETEGFKGEACKETMSKVVGQLGQTIEERATDDYYEDPDATQERQAQGEY